VCEGLPYIDMTKMHEYEFEVEPEEITKLVEAGVIPENPRDKKCQRSAEALIMIETVRSNYELRRLVTRWR
jgi:hypothetical protein